MRCTNRFYYLDSTELGAKIIRLPYAGRKFAMFIALPPKKNNGLTQLVENFNKIDMNEVLSEMDAITVSVLLPKFKLDYKANLNEVMRVLQIDRIFQTIASFSALAVPSDTEAFPEGAPISGLFHAASIVVDGKSANDTMSTASDFGDSKVDLNVAKFEACWPFVFFILDETTGGILFSGTVSKPEINV
jgi:serine protease inhibitor